MNGKFSKTVLEENLTARGVEREWLHQAVTEYTKCSLTSDVLVDSTVDVEMNGGALIPGFYITKSATAKEKYILPLSMNSEVLMIMMVGNQVGIISFINRIYALNVRKSVTVDTTIMMITLIIRSDRAN